MLCEDALQLGNTGKRAEDDYSAVHSRNALHTSALYFCVGIGLIGDYNINNKILY